jgi:hypothetical protein
VSDHYERAITFVRINDGHDIVTRIPGYWPLPVGATVEVGDVAGNRDFGVLAVRMRINGDAEPPRIDLYLDCVEIPLGLGL